MTKFTALRLLEEIEASKSAMKYAVEVYDDLRKVYGGPFYAAEKDNPYDPENTPYSWVTNVLPQLVFANPRWKIRSRKGGDLASIRAAALEHALNRWTSDYDLQTFLSEGPMLDAQFGAGIALISVERQTKGLSYQPNGDAGETEPMAPACHRISLRDYGEDTTAKDHDHAQWKAHRIVANKADLLERAKANPDEGWNVELIEATEGDTSEMSDLDAERRKGIQREEVVYWQVWIPGWKQQEEIDGKYGFHGTLVDIIEVSGEVDPEQIGYDYVRKPRAYYGPRTGPYIHFGCFKVPDETMPLAPLVATKAQSEQVNGLTRAIEENANSYKKFLLLDDVVTGGENGKPKIKSGRQLAKTIQSAKHLHVYTAPAFDKNKVGEFEIGGISAEQLASRDDARDVLNATLGLFQTMRGDTQGGQTATSDVIANEAATRRMGLMKLAADRSVARLGEAVGWHIHNDNRVRVFLGMVPIPDPETGEPAIDPNTGQPAMGEAWFEGGAEDDDPFEAYEFSIEPFSMEKVSEAQRQAQAAFLTELVTAVVPTFPMIAGYFDCAKYLEIVGNLANVPDLKALLNVQGLAQMAQIQVAAQVQQASPEGTSASPQSPKLVQKAPTMGAPQARPTTGSGGGARQTPTGSGMSGGSKNGRVPVPS